MKTSKPENPLLGTHVICHLCKKDERLSWDVTTNEQLQQCKLCFTCNFWREKALPIIRDNPKTARVDVGNTRWHYHVNPYSSEPNKSFLGHGGHVFTFVFDDNRIITSNDVWSQGDIPEHYHKDLPTNAYISRLPILHITQIPDDKLITFVRKCPFCEVQRAVTVDADGLRKWSTGTRIQDAFPTRTPQECETLKTGVCEECFPD